MNKTQLKQKIIQQLRQDLHIAQSVLTATHEAATHSESKAENKYDTRGLEAAYLADGQRRRLLEIQQALKAFEALAMQSVHESICIGALLEVSQPSGKRWLLLGPDAAGLKVLHEDQSILVISAQSPLGCALLGKEQGDQVQVGSLSYEVLNVL